MSAVNCRGISPGKTCEKNGANIWKMMISPVNIWKKKHSLETKMRSSPVNMWKQMRISPVNMLETYDNFTSKHVTFSPVNTWTIIWGYHQ
jgi:hypothetical protein